MSITDPLSVILVKADSKGDRLLFRYPLPEHTFKKPHPVPKKNPYALDNNADPAHREPCTNHLSNISEDNRLIGFTDEVLSNLFAVKQELCDKKFELKVNDVRFVGYPALMPISDATSNGEARLLIIIVFALRALASHSIVKFYYHLSKQINKSLMHEEKRRFFVQRETRGMTQAHDDGYDFKYILAKYKLAQFLKVVYEQVYATGIVEAKLENWLSISACNSQKVLQLNWNANVNIEPEYIHECLQYYKPYHALLLLKTATEIADMLLMDNSPTFIRLLSLYSPMKSLQAISLDTEISIMHIMEMTNHLVYWGKGTMIYPLCATNRYVIAHDAPVHVNSELSERFAARFPGYNLLEFLHEFSMPTSLSFKINPLNPASQQSHLVQRMVWCLQRFLLRQVHTYVQYMLDNYGAQSHHVTRRSKYKLRDHSRTRMHFAEIASLNATRAESESGASTVSDDVNDHSQDFAHSLESEANYVDDDRGEFQEDLLDDFAEHERRAILKIPASHDPDDLSLFVHLLRHGHFDGSHHVEEIMYLENLRRSRLLQILEKFRDVLITYETEDPCVSMFSSGEYTKWRKCCHSVMVPTSTPLGLKQGQASDEVQILASRACSVTQLTRCRRDKGISGTNDAED